MVDFMKTLWAYVGDFMKTLWTYCLLTALGASLLFVFMAWQDGEKRAGKVKDGITVGQDGAIAGQSSGVRRMVAPIRPLQDSDAAPPTTQRVKELRFSLQKLERLKDVHDATLKEAATNQGDIRQMVNNLGAN